MSKSPVLLGLCLALATLLVTGCEDDSDPDRTPPAGQGSIYVNNQTTSDIQVYVDGVRYETVLDFDDKYYDFPPGLYRVVLDEQGGDRTFREDVDVIEGRITVLDVAIEPFDDDFDVAIFFRTP